MVLDDLKTFPRTFKVLVASALIENMAFGLIMPYLTLYMLNDLMFASWAAGAVLAAYTIAAMPSMVLGGMLADKIGRRPVLLASLGLMSLTILAYFFVRSFEALFILALADSFVGSMYMPAANAMIADTIKPSDRPRAYSAIRIAWNVGIIFGPVLGAMIVAASGIRVLFVFGAGILGCAFVMNFIFIRETKPEKVETERITFRSVLSVSTDRPFLLLCAMSAVFWFFFSQWMSVLPAYANGVLGVEEYKFGLLFAVSALMTVALQLWITSQMVKYRRTAVLTAGQLVSAVGFALIFFATDFYTLMACIVIITIGELFYMSIISAIIADMAPEAKRGIYMGFSGLIQNLGAGLGFVFGMTLFGAVEDKAIVWLVFGGIGIVSCVGYYFLAILLGPERNMSSKKENDGKVEPVSSL